MESETMLTPKEKSPLPEKKKLSSEEDRIHDAASSRTVSQHTTNELFRPPERDVIPGSSAYGASVLPLDQQGSRKGEKKADQNDLKEEP